MVMRDPSSGLRFLSQLLGMTETIKEQVDQIQTDIGNVFAAPTSMVPVIGTAYRANDPTRATLLTVNVLIAQSITVAGTQVDTLELRIGPDKAGVEAGTSGAALDEAGQALTGIALTIGMANTLRLPMKAFLPVGWWYAVRRQVATPAAGAAARSSIISAFQQAVT